MTRQELDLAGMGALVGGALGDAVAQQVRVHALDAAALAGTPQDVLPAPVAERLADVGHRPGEESWRE